jgi:hypothetical protein
MKENESGKKGKERKSKCRGQRATIEEKPLRPA